MPEGAILKVERCHGITKRRGANIRCKHTTRASLWCWQHMKKLKKLRVTKSKIAGLGLWTTRLIKKGRKIADYTGELIVSNDKDYDNPYALQVRKHPPTFIDASRTNEPGLARYVNDCLNNCINNAEFVVKNRNNTAYLRALRDIQPNEEITVDYGPEYWKGKKVFNNPDIAQLRSTIPKKTRKRTRIADITLLSLRAKSNFLRRAFCHCCAMSSRVLPLVFGSFDSAIRVLFEALALGLENARFRLSA